MIIFTYTEKVSTAKMRAMFIYWATDTRYMSCCEMKGFLSYLVLWIISKEPVTGSQIASELAKRRGSKPSPGTIYPVLKDMKEKKLIKADENKVYSLTKKGQKELHDTCSIFCKIFYDMHEMHKCCH